MSETLSMWSSPDSFRQTKQFGLAARDILGLIVRADQGGIYHSIAHFQGVLFERANNQLVLQPKKGSHRVCIPVNENVTIVYADGRLSGIRNGEYIKHHLPS